jgi:hypothetical protein
MNDDRTAGSDLDRRHFLGRAAAVGAATAWAMPTVQSLASPAFATGSPAPTPCERLTGQARIAGGWLTTRKNKTKKLQFVGITVGDLRGNASPAVDPQITVVTRRKGRKRRTLVFHFDTLQTVACSRTRPASGHCPNRFVGTATGYLGRGKRKHNQTLSFQLEDHGRRGVDLVSITITGPKRRVSATGGVVWGDLHADCDC